jgi:pimeloyl-ACP methyl ester carboxylesterase
MLSTLSAHPPDINGLIQDILRDRRQENLSKSPIIFLGHSFGGTVLKQVYVATHPSNTDDPDYKALHTQIRGYVFFGTIHKDRDMSRAKLEVPEFWRALSRGASGTLGGHSHELEKAMYTTFRVNHAFRRLGGENLLINCFYETKGPGGLSVSESCHSCSRSEANISPETCSYYSGRVNSGRPSCSYHALGSRPPVPRLLQKSTR